MTEYYRKDAEVDWHLIPEYMHDRIRDYVMEGTLVGDFLTAVLSNNLYVAVQHADLSNKRALVNWVKFIYNYIPSTAWGCSKTVEAWQKHGGLRNVVRCPVCKEWEGKTKVIASPHGDFDCYECDSCTSRWTEDGEVLYDGYTVKSK